jgi:hypothetical protein
MNGKVASFVLSAVVAGFLMSQSDHKALNDCNHEDGIYISGTCQQKEVV